MKQNKSYGIEFYSILISWFFSAFSFASLLPFLSIFFAETYGLSIIQVGYFFLFTAIFRGILQIYAGDLSDLIGRKNLIVFSQVLRAIFLFISIYCIKNNFSIVWVLIIISLSYIFASMFQPLAQAALADHVSREGFIKAFSIVRVAGNFSWGLAPFFVGKFANINIIYIFYFSFVSSLISSIVLYFLFKDKLVLDSKKNREPISNIFSDKLFMYFCIISFLLCITISQMFSSLNIFFSEYKKLSKETIGLIFSINGITVALTQIPVSHFAKKYLNPYFGMAIGSFLYFMGYFYAGRSNSIYEYFSILICISLGEVFVIPLTQAAVANLSKEKMLGRYMGFYSMISVAGWSLGPYFGGKIIELNKNDFIVSWMYISLTAFVSGLGYLYLWKKNPTK